MVLLKTMDTKMKKPIKVLFQSRVELFDKRGGDTYQMECTKEAIEKLYPGFKIDIKPEIKVRNIAEYDIVNLFNIDWICETYPQARYAKRFNKPLVLSAIHHSESEILEFEDKCRFGTRRVFNTFIKKQESRDVLKNFYRSFLYPKKFYPTLLQAMIGVKNQQRQVLRMSDIVLVQTNLEIKEIIKDIGISDFKCEKVISGVSTNVFLKTDKQAFCDYFFRKCSKKIIPSKVLMSVGRIEPRKNQLALIETFSRLRKETTDFNDWVLIFIGDSNLYHIEYNKRFNNEIENCDYIYYLGRLPQNLVSSAMSLGGIYVQTSWFETLGLASLEAAIAGMRVVATGARIKEYLGNYATYCDPGDISSIKEAIMEARKSRPLDSTARENFIKKYTWEETAKQTVKIYKKLLAANN